MNKQTCDAVLDCLSKREAMSAPALVNLTGHKRTAVYAALRRLADSGHVVDAGIAPNPQARGKSTVQLWAMAPNPPARRSPVVAPNPTPTPITSGITITARAIASRSELQRVWS